MSDRLLHPSQLLAEGQVTGPREALDLVRRQYRLEIMNEDHLTASREGYEPYDFTIPLAAADRCIQEYLERIGPVETELFTSWASSPDENVRAIGEALLARAYARLAV